MRMRSLLFAPSQIRRRLLNSPEEIASRRKGLGFFYDFYDLLSLLPRLTPKGGLRFEDKYSIFDTLIIGSNPIITLIVLIRALKQGQKVVILYENQIDPWPYAFLKDSAVREIFKKSVLSNYFTNDYEYSFYQDGKLKVDLWFDDVLHDVFDGYVQKNKGLYRVNSKGIAIDPRAFEYDGQQYMIVNFDDQIEVFPASEEKNYLLGDSNNINSYNELSFSLSRHVKKYASNVKGVNHHTNQSVLFRNIVLTSSTNLLSNRKNAAAEEALITYHYDHENVLAYGSALWSAIDPDIMTREMVRDIVEASRYGVNQ